VSVVPSLLGSLRFKREFFKKLLAKLIILSTFFFLRDELFYHISETDNAVAKTLRCISKL
jgi:hypothetical protein